MDLYGNELSQSLNSLTAFENAHLLFFKSWIHPAKWEKALACSFYWVNHFWIARVGEEGVQLVGSLIMKFGV